MGAVVWNGNAGELCGSMGGGADDDMGGADVGRGCG